MAEDRMKKFLAAVDDSFLQETDKNDLRQAASRGVSQSLWSRFNDRLIEALVMREKAQQQFSRQLDTEVIRYTASYEKEKAGIDRKMWDTMSKMSSADSARAKMWEGYQKQIHALQAKLVGEVRRSSATLLHDVVLTTVALGNAKS